MRRLIAVILFCAGLFWLTPSNAPWAQSNIVGGGFYGDVKAASYTGPGDLASNWISWVGFRAFNLSQANAGAASFDWNCGGSTGTVHVVSSGGLNSTDTSSMSSTCGATTIRLTKLYDQTGNGNHFTHCTGGGTSGCPAITLSAVGTGPAIKATVISANSEEIDAPTFPAQAQPFTISLVAINNTGSVSAFFFGSSSAAGDPGFEWAGNNFTGQATTTGVAYALNNYYNGASSDANVNGTTGTGSGPGTNGITVNSMAIGAWPGQTAGDGAFVEFGVNSTSTEIFSSLVSNQRTYWGF